MHLIGCYIFLMISLQSLSSTGDEVRGFNAKGLVGGGFIVHAQRVRLWQGIRHPGVRCATQKWALDGGNHGLLGTWRFHYRRSPCEIDNS